MRFVSAREFTADRAWGAQDVAEVDGAVDMHYRVDGEERVRRLEVGDLCHAEPGDEHVAHPAPVARILVVERKGSL